MPAIGRALGSTRLQRETVSRHSDREIATGRLGARARSPGRSSSDATRRAERRTDGRPSRSCNRLRSRNPRDRATRRGWVDRRLRTMPNGAGSHVRLPCNMADLTGIGPREVPYHLVASAPRCRCPGRASAGPGALAARLIGRPGCPTNWSYRGSPCRDHAVAASVHSYSVMEARPRWRGASEILLARRRQAPCRTGVAFRRLCDSAAQAGTRTRAVVPSRGCARLHLGDLESAATTTSKVRTSASPESDRAVPQVGRR